MFKNFLNLAKFKTKKIQSSTIFKNFDESVSKNTNDMIIKKTFLLKIQIRNHKKIIAFKIVSTMRDLYLKQSWLKK